MVPQTTIDEALRALGIERLVLNLHDVSFPSRADEDIGRGSPYSAGGRHFLAFVRELGFTGVLLGPQGQTSRGNRSPYDGSVFSKNVLSIAMSELASPRFANLLAAAEIAAAVAATPAGDLRAHYTHAFDTQQRLLRLSADRLWARAAAGDRVATELTDAVAAFVTRTPWVGHDARFEAFAELHGTDDWLSWPALDHEPSEARIAEIEAAHAPVVHAFQLGQFVLDAQHRALRDDVTRPLALSLYGDLQVGLSLRDRWCRMNLFLPRYRMGAPPSRTNPEGQPWGYPVLDPKQVLGPLAFVRARITKLFAELDGVRVDHPHGLVCPWVYDGTLPDPMAAVVAGARLFETPASALHPSLAEYSIVSPDQIDSSVPAYDDDHVRALRPEQIAKYDTIFSVVMAAAAEVGRQPSDVLCEVLSTCPEPLHAVMTRHGLGRFRVTQKASLTELEDGYRGENAEPRDWTMIGNHDTDPLRAVMARWQKAGTLPTRADYLATRLEPDTHARPAFAAALVAEPALFARAMFAELFVGPAANVLVFFGDLYGALDAFNVPGLVSDTNWSLRVPRAFREDYEARVKGGVALGLPKALAMAMRARGVAFVAAHRPLLEALEAP